MNLASAAVLLFAPSIAAAKNVPAEGSRRHSRAPVAVIAMMTKADLPAIMDLVRGHPSLRKLPVFVGSYGINKDEAAAVEALPNAVYAPILKPFRSENPKRWVSPEINALLPPEYDGPIPLDLRPYPPEQRFRWGLELGRRLRDRIRVARREGLDIRTWQFDEIWPSCGKTGDVGESVREFLAGAVHGLANGRPELKDAYMPGIVFVSDPWALANLPGDAPGARLLYEHMHQGSLRVLGEEYVKFKGDPKKKAASAGSAQAHFARRGYTAAQLGFKYGPLLTPGYNVFNSSGLPTYLWGNVDGKDDEWVDDWRDAFLDARIEPGVAAIGMYNFVGGNERARVMEGAIAAVAKAAAKALKAIGPDYDREKPDRAWTLAGLEKMFPY